MFSFTEEQRSIQEMVRDYAQKVLKSRAEEIDKTGRYPAESIKELAEMGVMGLNISEEYGGAGMDTVSKVLAMAEVASCCGSTCEIFSTQLLVNDIVQHNASEEQKAKYLPMIAEGKLGAFALTEPNAGSDASGIRTKAVKDGEDYVITGSKCFISNMGPEEGEFVVVIAMTDPEKGTHGGATAFLVPRGTPGFTVGKTEDKLGVRGAAVSELSFDECRVPASAMDSTLPSAAWTGAGSAWPPCPWALPEVRWTRPFNIPKIVSSLENRFPATRGFAGIWPIWPPGPRPLGCSRSGPPTLWIGANR